MPCYKLVDLGTLGGPASYLSNGFDGILSNQGTLVGWADTSTPESNPSACVPADCFIVHAFETRGDTLTDLGALPGGLSSQAVWISPNGLIAESRKLPKAIHQSPEGLQRFVQYSGKMVSLSTSAYSRRAASTLWLAVSNSRGQVAGWGLNEISDDFSLAAPGFFTTETRGFLWEHGAVKDLGTLGGSDAFATNLNGRGQIAGMSYVNSTPNEITGIPTQDPFLWENGVMLDLGTLGGTFGTTSGLNERGEVIGQSNLAGNQASHPFLWTKSVGMQDLGTLGGNTGVTNWINDSGDIAGKADLAGPLPQNHDAVLWRHGAMIDLGTLPGDACSNAYYVNARGQVVGTSESRDLCLIPTGEHAFLWENGGPMIDLNTLIPAGSTLELTFALAINERGEIAGFGSPSGCAPENAGACGHAYLLIPCDDDHRGVEGCDYNMVDASALAAGAESSSTAQQHNMTASRTPSPGTIARLVRSSGSRSYPWFRRPAP